MVEELRVLPQSGDGEAIPGGRQGRFFETGNGVRECGDGGSGGEGNGGEVAEGLWGEIRLESGDGGWRGLDDEGRAPKWVEALEGEELG